MAHGVDCSLPGTFLAEATQRGAIVSLERSRDACIPDTFREGHQVLFQIAPPVFWFSTRRSAAPAW
jgi:hypothetical protein